ncbi:MAG: malate dehydrogenase (quinone) [Opitutales bacterium]|nr:malate dehydrogenase (quinone) [Opitutales bacterium]
MDELDVILIGSGVMSANLGALLKQLDPELRIELYEVTKELSQESSNGWNNAGTGHAGICEVAYTPDRGEDGEIKVDKAIEIFAEFEQTKQFWAYAVRTGMIDQPSDFINQVPHISFVYGQEQVVFLRSRYKGMSKHPFFSSMQYSEDPEQIRKWAPLLIEGREDQPVAATFMEAGTDVNFGEVSRKLIHWLGEQDGCAYHVETRVTDLNRSNDGWEVTIKNMADGTVRKKRAKFVFIGAGGGSLPLLQKAGVDEIRGYGGFPIGGQWLICEKPEIVERHHAKVYGLSPGAAPTMAVPHLDSRVLEGKQALLFGPYAAWTTKFLHRGGSFFDLSGSIKFHNWLTLLKVGISNLSLVGYLIQQGLQSMNTRLKELRNFYPDAKAEDWKLIDAGIRVQAIKKEDGDAGIVHFGTEVVTSEDRSISALLGASPGASVCVNIVLEVARKCFGELFAKEDVQKKLLEMIPTLDAHSTTNPEKMAAFEKHSLSAEEALSLRK